jgi:hypothetical protein
MADQGTLADQGLQEAEAQAFTHLQAVMLRMAHKAITVAQMAHPQAKAEQVAVAQAQSEMAFNQGQVQVAMV